MTRARRSGPHTVLLAVYAPHREGTVKPDVVLS